MTTELKKDPMILTKSVAQSVNETGKKRTTLSLSQEETVKLIEALTTNVSNERGVKLDIHITKKTSQAGREFDSGIFFVKAIQDPVQTGTAKFTQAPKAAFDVKAKVAAIKAQQEALANGTK